MNKQEGLTLIELLATISILVAVVTVMLVLGDRAVGQTGYLAAQTQAVFLSKEGVEIAKENRGEIRAFMEEETEESFWLLSYKEGVERKSDLQECRERLNVENSPGFYGYGSGEESPFSRCATVWPEDEDGGMEVLVETFFDHRTEEVSVKLHRTFYD